MRLVAALLVVFTASSTFGADKDEDKAKEVAAAFLKAVRANDVDAVMKTVDVPFAFDIDGKPEVFTNTDELKSHFKELLSKANPDLIADRVGGAIDLSDPDFRKEASKKELEVIDKIAPKGFIVKLMQNNLVLDRVLVRVKDGKAKVVGFPN